MTKKQMLLRQRSEFRKIRRRNRIKKILRIRRSTRRRNKGHANTRSNFLAPIRIKQQLPMIFSLIENPNEVIRFSNEVRNKAIKHRQKCHVIFDLRPVTKLDDGAIGILLSLINALAECHVSSFGNMPLDENAKQFFIDSGFLQHVEYLQKDKPVSNTPNNNWIVARGKDKTQNELIGREIRKLVFYLTGENRSYPPLYSMIQEICANSIEHANNKAADKNWLISFQYKTDAVSITMIDIGNGILASLRKKKIQTLKDLFLAKKPEEVLLGVFSKKYQSSTFDINRNKGLPKIKQCFDDERIENLFVISNEAYLDFSGHSCRNLSNNFRGTFYSWEVTRRNIESWNNRIA